jgi:hypothetical protein
MPIAGTPAEPIFHRIKSAAEQVIGGPLETLHQRPLPEKADQQLREATGALCCQLLGALAGPEAYIQGVPNFRIHRPHDPTSVVPFHSDVLYGHSPDEINYWVNLTPVWGTNSLWMASEQETEALHHALKFDRLSLAEFEELARNTARPIEDPHPGVHTFCCGQVHGSVLNETDQTRVSIDLRVIGPGGAARVKKRGGYFRAQWLEGLECPLPAGTPVTTVASLDEGTPVYLQRVAMEKFHPQGGHWELVEFHGLPLHCPTLTDAMARGPVLAYTVRQLREVPDLKHPIGFADERVWFTPDRLEDLRRLMREVNDK